MFTRSVAHNWIAPIKSAEGQGCFPRRAHGLFLAAYSRDIYICVCVYYIIYIYIYIYHPPWKFNILQEQIIWTVTRALYFLPRSGMPPRSPRVPLPHYRGLWRRMALFSSLKLKAQFALSKKVIIPRRHGRVADLLSKGGRRRGKGMDHWKRVTICQSELSFWYT